MNAPNEITGVKLNDFDWQLAVTRNMSFWHQILAVPGHYHHMIDFGVKVPLEQLAVTLHGTETHVFMYQPNVGLYNEEIKSILHNPERMENLTSVYPRLAAELLAALENCKSTLNSTTWSEFINAYRRFTAGLMITASLGRIGSEELARLLHQKSFSENDSAYLAATITYPDEHTPLFDSQLDLLHIGAQIQQKTTADPTPSLKEWLIKYQAIPVNFCEDPWTLKDAQKQLESILTKDCTKELTLVAESHAKKVAAANEKLKEINDGTIATVARAIAVGTSLNEFRKNVFCRVSLGYRDIFATIAQKNGSDNWRDCFYLTADEMAESIKGESLPLAELKAKREKVGYYSTPAGQLQFLDAAQLEECISEINAIQGKSQAKADDKAAIRGFSASRGKVTGRVKIVLNSKDFHKVERGDILVTTMTSVDFVPVMERAAAFVTNEGGITSHASIVAREMNKPCIIGTKIATKVLRDGDMVEVDAEKGIVTILQKA